jgi:hypothetical protein
MERKPLPPRLVLRYYPSGQFSFSRFQHDASDQALLALGRHINAFQTDNAHQIRKVEVSQFIPSYD